MPWKIKMPKPKKNLNNTVPGIMLYAKTPGLTSFSSLWSIKHALGTSKVGHTGTLDSFAEGLLVVLSGSLTHLVPHITGFKKTYLALVCFGEGTDTLDPGGMVMEKGRAVSKKEVEETLPKFTGALLQVPPVYSAVHVEGKRASDAARNGSDVSLEPRQVFIYSNKLLDFRPADESDPCSYALIEVVCSKGTYIRALARDIASSLGTYAHLSALRRTKVGPFNLEDAACYNELPDFTIENGIKNDRHFASLRDNPPPPANGKKHVQDSIEKISDIKNHLIAFTPEMAFKCGFKADILKPECERSYLTGRPLHGGMFKWLERPESVDNAEYRTEKEIAVFYEDLSFAGMIVRGDFKLGYGFVVPKNIEEKKSLKIFSWQDITDGKFPSEMKEKGCALTVGSFDGIHLGHKALIDAVRGYGSLLKGIVTFDKPFRSYDGSGGGVLSTLRQKLDEAGASSLDFAIVIDFSPDFVRMDGQSFVQTLFEKCSMKVMAEGRDFKCGYKGAFGIDRLSSFASENSIELRIVDDVSYGESRISSTRIRTAVCCGDFSSAEKMLGRKYAFDCTGLELKSAGNGVLSVEVPSSAQVLPEKGDYKVSLVCGGVKEKIRRIKSTCTVFTDESGARRLEFNFPSDIITSDLIIHDSITSDLTENPEKMNLREIVFIG